MDIEIVAESLSLTLCGVSGKAEDQNYGGAGQQLMDALWKEIGAKGLKHRGVNHWVYEDGDVLSTGVELEGSLDSESELALKEIVVPEYAYWKHVGPYSELGTAHADMHKELKNQGMQPCYPSIEVYGHWTEDESRLETDIIIAIK